MLRILAGTLTRTRSTPRNVGSLGTLWQISANALGSAPAVVGTRVFVGTSAGLEAVSKTTGALLWKAFATTSFYASPAVVGSTLYIGDGNNTLMYALNAATGAVIWSTSTGGAFESSPVVAGGLVYAGGVDGKIYAFAASTGKIAWTYTTGGFNRFIAGRGQRHALYRLCRTTRSMP